ncbi:hypothetical protein, partial [Cellulosimicrobium composti]
SAPAAAGPAATPAASGPGNAAPTGAAPADGPRRAVLAPAWSKVEPAAPADGGDDAEPDARKRPFRW